MNARRTFAIHGDVRDLDYVILVNGVPLERSFEPYEDLPFRMLRIDIDSWVRRGSNHLAALLFWPSERVPEPSSRARIELLLSTNRGPPFDRRPLLRWPAPPQPEAYPAHPSCTFEVEHPPPTRMWTDAEPVVHDATLQAEVAAFARRVYQILLARDLGAFLRVAEYRFKEASVAKGKLTRLNEEVAEIGEFLRPDFFVPGSRVAPFDPRNLRIDVYGDDRIIQVTHAGDPNVFYVSPPNRDEVPGYMLRLPLYLAKIRGRLTWVR